MPHFNHQHFLNRELSLLAFNRRVLGQAENPDIPLLERLKFLSIVSSNLDEFFEVRVASLKDEILLGHDVAGADGVPLKKVLEKISHLAHQLIEKQYRVLQEDLLPALAQEGIQFVRRTDWNDTQRAWIKTYFFREMMPVLTPIGLDPSHPFPKVLNKSLNFVVELEGRDAFGRQSGIAIVQAPRVLPRLIQLPPEIATAHHCYVFLSSILHAHVGDLFDGMQVLGCYQFRVTRDTDLSVDEEEVKDLRKALQGELRQRQFGHAVRLEVADNCTEKMSAFLLEQFHLKAQDLYPVNGPVNLARMMQVPDMVDRPDLKYPPYRATLSRELDKNSDLFAVLGKQDILLHHPFQSFAPVVGLLQQAANDKAVIAIKMTIYRAGENSVLMDSLIQAARSGKEVSVVLELKARFDEETNIAWASKLEDAGAHVVYGVVGHKTHAKMLLIVRREEGVLRRYAHVSTGNYHIRTANFYTDFGLMTANDAICEDINAVFMQLTGLGNPGKLRYLWQSPFTLHENVLQAIAQEMQHAAAGKAAHMTLKMNSLVEPEVIQALYMASQAGVKINLIVRGVCILRPAVAGLSDNIRVISIVGRFLEHSRIFHFHNDGEDNVYISSADWMGRNFFRRIEIATPILDSKLKRRVIREGLRPYLLDNVEAWEMDETGDYKQRKPRSNGKIHSAQMLLAELAKNS